MGATVDPKTGEMIWTMHRPLEAQRAFYDAHPPFCISAFTCTPTKVPLFKFDGHGEPVNAIFQLACPCGNDRFKLYAHTDPDADPDDEGMLAPIEIECMHCNTFRLLFDPAKHGWDGLHQNAAAATMRDDTQPTDHDESLDNLYTDEIDLPHQVIVRFEHGSEILGNPEHPIYRGREQDLFSWITILAKDAESGEVALLYENECA